MYVLLFLLACRSTTSAPELPIEAPPQTRTVVAFGDVHGDLAAATSALRTAGAIDEDGHWSGGTLQVVQVGDQLDRGDGERAILELFQRLRTEARAAGGAFHPLIGNHETMNVSGDLRYVTPGGYADFADLADPGLTEVEPAHRGRVAAFRPGGPYATMLATHDVVLVLEDTVFVHGGVLPEHVAYGLDRINAEVSAWMRGEAPEPTEIIRGESPLWSRHYSDDPDADDCQLLATALAAVPAKRMVVAHTVQEDGINAACGGLVWRVDVGMSKHYGGTVQVLTLTGDAVAVVPAAPGER